MRELSGAGDPAIVLHARGTVLAAGGSRVLGPAAAGRARRRL